ncbi:cobyrinate a,c-diamide synthase [Anaerostipes sp.]|uniref:cobyrinate a,c-diamide synthase n=1 Tax=Anaerostipes sp. TaxID=1872530 RepID=UPI0025C72FF4|nr:cobyrinate a,c-diamide synthase [Anaerostipes sp.]MBS7007393.1 cobyrinate a,c-diamide synthase [Anaerostipes sp.]
MKIDRLMITAPASAGGKTMITCGILAALSEMGKNPVSFKCGPDYIDPMFHRKAIGTESWNLDPFFSSPEQIRAFLAAHAENAGLAVMEGVMGYYDGLGGTTAKASAYELCRITKTPAVLAVNAKGMSTSLLAQIHGFLSWKKDSQIKGILLNRISPMMYPRLKKLIEEELHIPVAGYVPEVCGCTFKSRHLGLVLPDEIRDIREKLMQLADIMKETIEWETLLRIAENAPKLEDECVSAPQFSLERSGYKTVKIGVARDEAFCFIYRENLELLQKMGAEIVPFSPLHDSCLPENLDGLILYGGYPELYGRELEKNVSMRREIFSAVSSGLPCMAECGGFLYLHREMEDQAGILRKMAGVIPGKALKKDKLSRFGYITLHQKAGTLFGTDSPELTAHEFHYYDSDSCGKGFCAKKPVGRQEWECIHGSSTLFAGFPHFYYYGNQEVPKAFLMKCHEYQTEKRKQDGYQGTMR